jgi:endonuclease YncB( thermonuclease family)
MMEWLRILLLSSTLMSVTDGDTVKLADGQSVRLKGLNTPEIFSPKCEKEKQLGFKARDRLIQLTRKGANLTLSGGTCAYGRLCGTLTVLVNGVREDAATVLIREGLAEPMVCLGSCPRPRDWCS